MPMGQYTTVADLLAVMVDLPPHTVVRVAAYPKDTVIAGVFLEKVRGGPSPQLVLGSIPDLESQGIPVRLS